MNSYEILNVSKEASDKEIEVAYEDLKRKYNPSLNTSIHAYKKYREILKAYESIKDEQRRKMYNLQDEQDIETASHKEYELYSYNDKKASRVKSTKLVDKIDLSDLMENIQMEDINLTIDVSYLYYLLNLKYTVQYSRRVKCEECDSFTVCPTCNGAKVVEYKQKNILCPTCNGEGKVSNYCHKCNGEGTYLSFNKFDLYVDEEYFKVFKNLGNEYFEDKCSDLKINFNYYDKENYSIKDNTIEIKYYLNKEETKTGINKEFISENGAFKLELDSYVEDGTKKEVLFNNKKIIFTFYNSVYDGEDRYNYLVINKKYKNKVIYFNDEYNTCNVVADNEHSIEIRCDNKIVINGLGYDGMYGGKKGNLVINVEFVSSNELLYVSNLKVIETSKLFNMLGGRKDDLFHFGFKKEDAVIEKDNLYYLLTGHKSEKRVLKDYFLFKLFSLIIWCLIPLVLILVPYSKLMYLLFIGVCTVYFAMINILMGREA